MKTALELTKFLKPTTTKSSLIIGNEIKMKTVLLIFALLLTVLPAQAQESKESALYQTILALDKQLFDSYNACSNPDELAKHAALYAEDIEFFHDMGGLATSKPSIIESIRQNICGRVKREYVEGSMEVHRIPNYGVVVMGLHKFHNLVEKSVSEPSKFISFWRIKGDSYEMAKVVSLHWRFIRYI